MAKADYSLNLPGHLLWSPLFKLGVVADKIISDFFFCIMLVASGHIWRDDVGEFIFDDNNQLNGDIWSRCIDCQKEYDSTNCIFCLLF